MKLQKKLEAIRLLPTISRKGMGINILLTFFGLSVKFFLKNAEKNIKKIYILRVIHKNTRKIKLQSNIILSNPILSRVHLMIQCYLHPIVSWSYIKNFNQTEMEEIRKIIDARCHKCTERTHKRTHSGEKTKPLMLDLNAY